MKSYRFKYSHDIFLILSVCCPLSNLSKLFPGLLHQQFAKSKSLHKIFNRNMVKVSHNWMENISQIIKRHNKRISQTNGRPVARCNCRDKSKCPMNGNCKVENVVSICIASTTKISMEHVKISVAEGDSNHIMSFRNQKYKKNQ